jgi:hypothetical protein
MADTPQVKLVKRLSDAYSTLNINNVEPLLSKDFQFETVPESANLPHTDEGKSPPDLERAIFRSEQSGGAYPTPENRPQAQIDVHNP